MRLTKTLAMVIMAGCTPENLIDAHDASAEKKGLNEDMASANLTSAPQGDPLNLLEFAGASIDPLSREFSFFPKILEPVNAKVVVAAEVFGPEKAARDVLESTIGADGVARVDIRTLLPTRSPARLALRPSLLLEGVIRPGGETYEVVVVPGQTPSFLSTEDFSPPSTSVSESVSVKVRLGGPSLENEVEGGGDL